MKSNGKNNLFICISILAFSFLISSLLLTNNANKAAVIPVNDYSGFTVYDSSSEVKAVGNDIDCYSLTVGGTFVGYFKTAEEAYISVEQAAFAKVNSEYENYESYDIMTPVEIKMQTMSEDEFAECPKNELPPIDINVYLLSVETKSVPFSTTYIDNANEYMGNEKVKANGSDGVTEETYRLTYLNGEKINSEKIDEKVITKPVNKVIERGTKYRKETQIFVFPYDGRITSQFGGRYLMGYTNHRGIDIAGLDHEQYNKNGTIARDECYGDNIHAAGDGKVVFAGFSNSYGYYVVIEHPNKLRTYYAHQSKILVKVGDVVKQGDVIGRIGNSGNSYGAHVHFEVRVPGSDGEYTQSVDPADYLLGYDDFPLDD